MEANIPEKCLRSEQEIETRKHRSELYKKLRKENTETQVSNEMDDFFDDFGVESGKRSEVAGEVVNIAEQCAVKTE